MKKKLLSIFLALTVCMSMSLSSVFAFPQTEIKTVPESKTATVNGENVPLDVPAKNIDGRVMVPVRFVSESLDIPVLWDQKTKTVTIGKDKEIVLTVGEKQATVNGSKVALDAPPVVMQGRTLVPLRFITECFDADVNWDQKTKTASIDYSEEVNQATELYSEILPDSQKVIDALDSKFAWEVGKKIASFGTAKDGRGFRLTGTESSKQASDYAYETFKSIGLNPEYHTFPTEGWTFIDSQMTIKGHEDKDYEITSAPYTVATAKEGLTGEIVYIGKGTKEDLAGVDLKGKIALVDWDMDVMAWYNDLAKQVENHGAAGLIYYSTAYYGIEESGMSQFVGTWSGTDSAIPVWAMNLKEGKELSKLAEKEKLTATLTSESKMEPKATGYNVFASIKGSKYPDEYILIEAHTDGYFHCFQDDAILVGMMMSMAKAMVDTNYKPDRTIMFIASDGEESGGTDSFYDWLQGGWNLIRDKIDQLGGKIVDVHILEILASKGADEVGYTASDSMYLYSLALAGGLAKSGDYDYDFTILDGLTTETDGWVYSYYGAPTSGTPFEDTCYPIYHSRLDNPEFTDYKLYENNVRAHTTYILNVDKQGAAPYDLSKTPEDYIESLDSELLKAQGLDGSLADAAESYMKDTWKLLDLNLQIEKAYKKAVAGGKDLKGLTAQLGAYNQGQRDAAKTVIEGTQYVGVDAPMNQIVYYQYMPQRFEQGIALLKAGKGQEFLEKFTLDNEDLGLYFTSLMGDYEKSTWQNTFREAIDPIGKNCYWVTDRLMKVYDHYGIMDSVTAKVAAKNTDFSTEIAELDSMRADAKSKLTDGYKADIAMWNKAKSQLPITQAEKVLKELEAAK